jgi:hypothetical protein
MFRGMRNASKNGTIVQEALAGLRRRLPPGWSAEEAGSPRGSSLRLLGPDSRSVEFSVVVRKGLVPRDVPMLLAGADGPRLIVALFLSERARQLITQGGVSYADATGNLRVVATTPAIFLEGLGAERDPTRTARPLQSLRGAAAGRVVRALAELDLPLGVRAIANASATPLGTVSRVVTFLEAEALLTRDAQKRVVAVDMQAMLMRWSRDYELTKSNELRTFLEPRGLPALWPKLARLSRYAATGSTAGPGIAPTRIAMLYVDDPDDAARVLGLVPADAGANVWLLRPFDDVVFTRTRRRVSGEAATPVEVVTVAAAQAVVDLASAPGRGPQESEALVQQMMGAGHAT